MQRTITVRGTGKVTAAPDRIELTMNLSALDPDYGRVSEDMDRRTEALKGALEAAGFGRDELKTASFNVNTEYRGVHDPETGEYRQEFAGYRVFHGTTLGFSLDMARLADLLEGVAGSGAEPELSIRFTVSDPEVVRREALRKAAADARDKAELLAAASGVKLGELLTIQYEWGDIRLESRTLMDTANGMVKPRMMKAAFAAEMAPEDIAFTDSAGFVWEIV